MAKRTVVPQLLAAIAIGGIGLYLWEVFVAANPNTILIWVAAVTPGIAIIAGSLSRYAKGDITRQQCWTAAIMGVVLPAIMIGSGSMTADFLSPAPEKKIKDDVAELLDKAQEMERTVAHSQIQRYQQSPDKQAFIDRKVERGMDTVPSLAIMLQYSDDDTQMQQRIVAALETLIHHNLHTPDEPYPLSQDEKDRIVTETKAAYFQQKQQ